MNSIAYRIASMTPSKGASRLVSVTSSAKKAHRTKRPVPSFPRISAGKVAAFFDKLERMGKGSPVDLVKEIIESRGECSDEACERGQELPRTSDQLPECDTCEHLREEPLSSSCCSYTCAHPKARPDDLDLLERCPEWCPLAQPDDEKP